MDTPSSSTPTTDPEEIGPQGPVDWSRETPSDDRLSAAAKALLRFLAELAER